MENTARKIETIADGWYHLSNEDYHAMEGVSKSMMSKILDCPARINQPGEDEDKDSLQFGSAFHTAVLEPDKFSKEYVVIPADCRVGSGKGQRERLAELEDEARAYSQTIIKSEWVEQIGAMRDAVMMQPAVKELGLLEGGEAEISGFYTDPDFDLLTKIRPDYLKKDRPLIVDLKSAADPMPRKFTSVAYDKGYHIQAAHYLYTAMKLTGIPHEEFYFIAVEKPKLKGQYIGVQIYKTSIHSQLCTKGLMDRARALSKFAECYRSGIWPGYETGVRELDLPGWVKRSQEFAPIFE